MNLIVFLAVLAVFLIVIALMQPLAARAKLPLSVVLAVVGIVIGGGATFLLRTDLTDALNPMALSILLLPIDFGRVPVGVPADAPVPDRADDRGAAAARRLGAGAGDGRARGLHRDAGDRLRARGVRGAAAGGVPDRRGDRRDHRSVGRRRDFSRHQRAGAARAADRGREPAQRRGRDQPVHGVPRARRSPRRGSGRWWWPGTSPSPCSGAAPAATSRRGSACGCSTRSARAGWGRCRRRSPCPISCSSSPSTRSASRA